MAKTTVPAGAWTLIHDSTAMSRPKYIQCATASIRVYVADSVSGVALDDGILLAPGAILPLEPGIGVYAGVTGTLDGQTHTVTTTDIGDV